MKKYKANKLIRSGDYEAFKTSGIRMTFVENPDKKQYVLKKVIEEAKELAQATKMEKKLGEAADIIEALELFFELEGVDFEEVLKMKKQKLETRGNYKDGHIIDTIELPDNHEKVAHYDANSDRYIPIK